MQVREVEFPEGLPIDGYAPGHFRINGQVYAGPLLLAGDQVTSWAGMDDPAPLLALAGRMDVIFLGTGADLAPPPATLRAALEGAGIGLEMMNTPAACRSFNVCLAEGRRVAAALIPV